MDSLHFRNIKIEKAKAMHKYRRLQKVTTLFRVIEVCVFLIILSRSSSLFPFFAFKFSGEYFQRLFTSLISPRFVFIIGNMIVIILFLKSRQPSTTQDQGNTTNHNKADVYDEYVQSCQRTTRIVRESKECSTTLTGFGLRCIEENKESKEILIAAVPRVVTIKEKKIQRSKSESLFKNMNNQDRPLRRSVTERCLESVDNGGIKAIKSSYPVDEMSNEEFRLRVEAFIARQQRLLREE